MKRTIVIAVLAGMGALAHSSAFAGNPNMNGPRPTGPQGLNNLMSNQGVGGTMRPGQPVRRFAQQAAEVGQPGPQGQGQPNVAPQQNNVAPQGIQQGGPQGPQQGAPQGGQPGVAGPQQNLAAPAGGNAQAAPQGIGPVMKGMHGRFDGGTIAPPSEGSKVVGGIMMMAGKDVKPMENSYAVSNYLVNFCRYKEAVAKFGCNLPAPTYRPGPWFMPPPPPFGDVELLGVGMVADGTAEQGPTYRVTMFNNSPMASRHFHVSMMAYIGEMSDQALVINVPVKVVEANAVGTVDVQLPVGVMSIGAPAGPFDTLTVIVDSFDELMETNELNNIATISREEVASVTTVVEGAPAAVAGPAAVAAPAEGIATPAPDANAVPAPAEGQGAAPQQGEPAPVASNQAPQGIDTSGLDLDTVAGAAELLNR